MCVRGGKAEPVHSHVRGNPSASLPVIIPSKTSSPDRYTDKEYTHFLKTRRVELCLVYDFHCYLRQKKHKHIFKHLSQSFTRKLELH